MKNNEEISLKSAGIVVFTFSRGRIKYLILKHHQTNNHWGFPKGRIEKGESDMLAAKRELKEETGLKGINLINKEEFRHQYSFIHKEKSYKKEVVYFLGYSSDTKINLSNEHTNYFWGTFEETMSKLDKIEIKDVLNKAHETVTKYYGPEKKNSDKEELIFVSFPKAGRTWITFLLARIFQRKYNLPEMEVVNLENISNKSIDLPNITIAHEDEPHKKDIKSLDRSKIKYYKKKIILIVRDPRDIIVSFYFHQSKRKGENNYKKDISSFLFEKVGGFKVLIEYYNIWAKNIDLLADFLLIKYEDFSKNTMGEVRKILKFMNIEDVSDEEIEEAISFASFENMKEMEAKNKFNVKRLRPGNSKDPDSYKVRRGVIGGYKDYLEKKDIEKLNKEMKKLSDIYGYK
ncbi:MAG: sulfotransferase domain-containing protein [Nanoarchaeota archaeon]